MSGDPNPATEPDRDAGPAQKREAQIEGNQECDTGTFKVPFPYKHPNDKLPLQPAARRPAVLYQPWTRTHASTGGTKAPSLPRNAWAGAWAEFHHLYGGLNPPQHRYGSSGGAVGGPVGDLGPAAVQPGCFLRYPLKFMPVTVLPGDTEGPAVSYRREAPRLREPFCLETFPGRRGAPRGDRGSWGRRRDQRMEAPPPPPHSCVSPASLSPSFPIPSLLPVEDRKPREELLYEHLVSRGVQCPGTTLCPVSSSPSSSSSLSTSSGFNPQHEFMSFQAEQKVISRCSSSPFSSPPPSPDTFPWLLPHFAAGSLIELRDGRLKRVEDLRTEDFLLGSAARQGLRLSCCTVQSITSSTSSCSSSSRSPALSRLLILLHDQNSQELVDVYVEYPFFVRGRGWSSCCPERTARLCGLSCSQLSVGDVCLALTPASPGGPPHPGEAGQCGAGQAGPPVQVPAPLEGPVEGE
ncbi:hypothetical protein NHX12_030933 [Muraenolepis orangiensis]|uniref:AXH domain-containing protein n=1 Tax=Muraenolepis orangiensis TaxID=630683 RepID=A0A9Q0IM43_9TELE|nr:hypothetical protein NHX12_030933 [Muraenolepis orangiensis]